MKGLLCSILFFLVGCAELPRPFPIPQNGLLVKGDKIFHNDKLFAELRYLAPSKSDSSSYRGLAIYYYPYKKEVWIFPEKGWSIFEGGKNYYTVHEIEQIWYKRGIRGFSIDNKRADKSEFISAWCFDVRISDDGKYIYYKTRGIFFDSSHKYLVEYGVSK